ncbi:MAG TPA: cbb3-type cytochrome c oxidase subunit 3 [Candidatus Aquabacterium excrementipullorum]|nr:cbb3-type cytochrome c oxidase subunit 3 [Candidatus Aquabacterium excrementipullorum]
MDIGTLRSLVTVVSMGLFVGIVWWAYAARNKARFDEAARLPLTDD